MSLYAIGDTHLSFGTDKPMDIFRGWQNFEERLEKNWNSLVTENDTVVVAGDISWAMNIEGAKEDFRFLDKLNGRKLIMKGNHDYWWSTKKKADTFFEENGFGTLDILFNNAYRFGDVSVCGTRGWFYDGEKDNKVLLREAGRLRMSINEAKKLGGEPVVFLHYPPLNQEKVCEEIYSVLVEEGIKRCYYAHLHGASQNFAFTGERDGIKFSLISGDFLNFCPKLIEKY